MKDIEIYAVGMVHASACALNTINISEVERIANMQYPTGVSHSWSLHDGSFKSGESNPCPCDEAPETRSHYLLSC